MTDEDRPADRPADDQRWHSTEPLDPLPPSHPSAPPESPTWWARPATATPAADEISSDDARSDDVRADHVRADHVRFDDAARASASASSGYSQPDYGLPPGDAAPYGQAPYPASSYGQAAYGQAAYGQPHPQAPYEQPQQPPSWQSSFGQPVTAGNGARGRRPRGLPSLLLVALVAALVGAGVGSGVVAATRDTNTSSNDTPNPVANPAPTVVASLPAGSSAGVAQALLPSVVSIIVTGSGQQDEGTGIILTADGQIVTNNHVVEAAAGGGVIAVTFTNGSTAKASIVGRDPTSDLAVIKATDVSGLHPATLAQNPTIVVGQQVVTIGSPLGLSNTVTSGIVSSLNRPVCTQNCNGSSNGTTPTVLDAIQTDAAINPGNSGGPLVDMAGHVIGINTAIATLDQQQEGQSGNIGVGFAIPISEAKRVIAELQQTGHASHAVIGIGVNDSIDSTLHTPNGAKIVSVTAGGPADKAGIKSGDILVKFGGRTVVDADSLIAATHAAVPNSTVEVTYMRGGQRATVSVKLGSATSN
jgi:putative serine protease PepD